MVDFHRLKPWENYGKTMAKTVVNHYKPW
jgi:hypothetical protein